MSSVQHEDYPPFVTVLKTASRKYRVAVMEWSSKDERYEAHWTSYHPSTKKAAVEADAKKMAEITSQEYREFAIC